MIKLGFTYAGIYLRKSRVGFKYIKFFYDIFIEQKDLKTPEVSSSKAQY